MGMIYGKQIIWKTFINYTQAFQVADCTPQHTIKNISMGEK